jgi:hypothetical protein
MGEVITVGLDIAKSVFRAHGGDGGGVVVIRKRVVVERGWSSSRPYRPV